MGTDAYETASEKVATGLECKHKRCPSGQVGVFTHPECAVYLVHEKRNRHIVQCCPDDPEKRIAQWKAQGGLTVTGPQYCRW